MKADGAAITPRRVKWAAGAMLIAMMLSVVPVILQMLGLQVLPSLEWAARARWPPISSAP